MQTVSACRTTHSLKKCNESIKSWVTYSSTKTISDIIKIPQENSRKLHIYINIYFFDI